MIRDLPLRSHPAYLSKREIEKKIQPSSALAIRYGWLGREDCEASTTREEKETGLDGSS